MHFMEKNVDDGPIIDCELFDVAEDITPKDLLSKANNAGWILVDRFLINLKTQKMLNQ